MQRSPSDEQIQQCGTALPDMSNPYVFHVYPTHKGEPVHDTNHGGECWCEPTCERHGEQSIWYHKRVN